MTTLWVNGHQISTFHTFRTQVILNRILIIEAHPNEATRETTQESPGSCPGTTIVGKGSLPGGFRFTDQQHT